MSTLNTTNLKHPSSGSNNIVLAADGSATAQLSSINGGPLAGTRNRIINGDMRIDQRNAGAAVTTDGAFPVDRFLTPFSTDGAFSCQQDSSVPAGFNNSIKWTATTADASLGATQYALIRQKIEGFNVADLGFGSASAKTVTLSFWVRSSLTGSFGGSITNSAQNRCYPFSYTIFAANTWEQKSITIPGDTTGTWLTTNGIGLDVFWGLGVGSTYSGTASAWTSSSNIYSVTGSVSVIGTLNATFYITGVQLEPGTVATPFERRSFGQELALCQRYYVIYRGGAGANDYAPIGSGNMSATNTSAIYITTPVTLRASPTFAYSGSVTVSDGVTGSNVSAITTQFMSSSGGAWLTVTTGGGQTAGRGAFMYTQNATTNFFTLSSEL
jgi:hypothetical protein